MKPDLHIGATQFKAKCLELMQQVHDRKRNKDWEALQD
jgi:hypothetical protein